MRARITATSFPSCIVQVSGIHVCLAFVLRISRRRQASLSTPRQALSSIFPFQRKKEKFIGPSFLFRALLAELLSFSFFIRRIFVFEGVSFRFVAWPGFTSFAARPYRCIGSLNLVDFDAAAARLHNWFCYARNRDGSSFLSFPFFTSSFLYFRTLYGNGWPTIAIPRMPMYVKQNQFFVQIRNFYWYDLRMPVRLFFNFSWYLYRDTSLLIFVAFATDFYKKIRNIFR